MTLVYNFISGSAELCVIGKWLISHDPHRKAIVVCSDRGYPCQAIYHFSPAIHSGPAFRYGRWWWPRTARHAFELATEWAETHSTKSKETAELEEAVELYRIIEESIKSL